MSTSTPVLISSNPSIRGDRNGITVDAALHFTATTLAEAEALRKEWMNKKFFAFMPSGRYHNCKSANVDTIGGNSYILHLSILVGDDTGDASSVQPRTKEDFTKAYTKKMGYKEMRWLPEWWGIVKADKTQAGLQAFNKMTSTKNKDLEYTWYYEFKSIFTDDNTTEYYGLKANEGDYIYKNAFPRIRVQAIDKSKEPTDSGYETITTQNHKDSDNPTGKAWEIGSPRTALSPYLSIAGAALTAAQARSFCGHPFAVFVYSTSFWTKKKFDSIDQAAFMGVNPTAGFPDSIYRKLSPWDSGEHRWRTIDMDFDHAYDNDGNKWTKINLKFEMAPYGFKWNILKVVNGAWSWHTKGL